ncbi:MAG: BamA/TamA family outer membrane protein [Gemmatimonadetes bacterium]|nr:BamA/TamA family outer membrane protein [Gemmatimonadota bacterium]
MRETLILALALSAASPAGAQDSTIAIRSDPRGPLDRLEVRQLPRDVAEEVIRFFNGPGTLHFSGATRIPAARGIDGDVAILGGPVTIAGRISGGLVVVNGDVIFEPGAVVGGDVIVVGGSIEGTEHAAIAGEMRAYRDPLRYRRQGDEIVYAPRRDIRPRWVKARQYDAERGSSSRFVVAFGGTYNRVEGLPIVFGPRVDVRLNDGMRLQADAQGIFRTAGDFSFQSGDFGYRARGELVFGGRFSNIGFGARGYDVVVPVEPWPLKDYEAGWASFLLHEDYRDYYRRDGGSVFATLRLARPVSLTAEFRDERQSSVVARDPWTLFRSDRTWRANPAISAGRYRSAVASFRLDTRSDRSAPTSGLFLTGEYEVGEGTDVTNAFGEIFCFQEPCPPPAPAPGLEDGKLTYQRVFFDLRGYTRVTPAGRFNLRLAGGGWVGGDPLPRQRRFALGYPDPLPGYGFRQVGCGDPSQFESRVVVCDRVLLAQAEFRTHLGFDFGPEWANDWGDDGEGYEPFHVSGPDIVVFADAGRAWQVGPGAGEIPSDRLPPLGSFRTDVGLGLDFGPIGFYFAKVLDQGDRPITFTVRMGRRF